MADLKFEVDVEAIAKSLQNFKKELEKDINKGVQDLASMAHAKTLELARDELGSLSQLYMDNVEFSNPEPNFWVVSINEKILWIEEGRKGGFMEELLDGKSAKTSAKGEKYAVIPFKHNENPSQQSPKAQKLADEMKTALRKEGVNWKKIEYGKDGTPRTGLLHKINIDNPRMTSATTGAQHKSPLTQGIAVYQTAQKDGSVRRDVMTFRIIHEKHREEGLWNHPGRDASRLLDKAYDWAMDTWKRDILPAIVDKHKSK